MKTNMNWFYWGLLSQTSTSPKTIKTCQRWYDKHGNQVILSQLHIRLHAKVNQMCIHLRFQQKHRVTLPKIHCAQLLSYSLKKKLYMCDLFFKDLCLLQRSKWALGVRVAERVREVKKVLREGMLYCFFRPFLLNACSLGTKDLFLRSSVCQYLIIRLLELMLELTFIVRCLL